MSIRVVTSEYNDQYHLDTWIPKLNKLEYNYTIYHKKDNLQIGEEIITDDNNIFIPNYGRCEYAFLYHIIKNYDTLDDYTLFVKSHWYIDNTNFFNHLYKCKLYDYLSSGHSMRYTIWNKDDDIYDNSNQIIERYFYPNNHPFVKSIKDIYNLVYSDSIPLPKIQTKWAGGIPCFSVSKKLIIRHPKNIYIKLLEQFYPQSWDIQKGFKYFNTIEEQIIDVGKHYHDVYGRFWSEFFTHNLPTDKKFNILHLNE